MIIFECSDHTRFHCPLKVFQSFKTQHQMEINEMQSMDKDQSSLPFVLNYIQRKKCCQPAHISPSDQNLRTDYYQMHLLFALEKNPSNQ